MGTSVRQHRHRLRPQLRDVRIGLTSAAIITLLTVGLMGSDSLDLLAQTFGIVPNDPPEPAPVVLIPDDPAVDGIRLSALDIHPDVMHAHYLQTSVVDSTRALVPPDVARSFQSLLSMYEYRQSIDDNFTARAFDDESGVVLADTSLEEDRLQYAESGKAKWPAIDRKRRDLTRDLVDRLVQAGHERHDIRVRWGRRNQVLEARTREAPFIEHEIHLARYYGLSLLAAEIGTVETFNDDRLVSRVGARSRYQLMPAMLRARNVHHYRLRTRAGIQVNVREEWHPLITMQAAFIVARAYSNAVGHEIPGLSAYHTGPYNIFRVFREYLTSEGERFGPSTNVIGGFLWALTDGFDRISNKSTFKNYSRGYVPTLYASLRATQDVVVDTSATMFAEEFRLREGKSLFLSELLDYLDDAEERLTWRNVTQGSLYDRFRQLNPHFNLPRSTTAGAVPEAGDVFLVSTAPGENAAVRFFLPLGSSLELQHKGVESIDYDAMVRYDRTTFDISDEPLTVWDHLYAALIEDVRTFGFTFENREQLAKIVANLEDAAAENPTFYRKNIRDVARLHERVWASEHFDRLAQVVPAARGRLRLPAYPPDIVRGESTPHSAGPTIGAP